MNKVIKKGLIGIVIGVVVGVILSLVTQPGYFPILPEIIGDFEAKTYDMRFSTEYNLTEANKRKKINDIIIIDIDERSIDSLGRFQDWPRDYYAHLIEFLHTSGAKAVGFDILFFEKNKIPKGTKGLVSGEIYDALNAYYTRQNDNLVAATKESDITFHSLSFSQSDKDIFLKAMDTDPLEKIASSHKLSLREDTGKNFISQERLDYPFKELSAGSKGLGFANPHPDADGVNRQLPLIKYIKHNAYAALSLRMASHVLDVPLDQVSIKGDYICLGDTVQIPMHRNQHSDGWVYINYYGPYRTFQYISLFDVLKQYDVFEQYGINKIGKEQGKYPGTGSLKKMIRSHNPQDSRRVRLPHEYFRDKVVLVGASAAGLMDLRVTPVSSVYPGVEIHASLIWNIINNDFIVKAKPWITIMIMMVMCILCAVVALVLKPYWAFLLNLIQIVLFLIIGYQYFTHENIWIELVRPVFAVLLTYMSVMVYRYLTEEREKKFIRGAFQHYLSPTVISQLTDNPNMLKLGGEKKILTAFFSDVAGFSTISEKLDPEGLVLLLNEYLTVMTDIVLKHEGTVDKFEGDAIIAFFGAPVSYEDHARRACLVSLGMQRSLISLCEKWSQEPHWPEIVHTMKMRIGLNTGPMVVGNMGSKTRMDYTMMGDSVNLAARLEGANKQYGTYTMISETTRHAAQDFIESRLLDKIRVVGKSEPVLVHELLTEKGNLTKEDTQIYSIYNEGISLYQDQQWDTAISAFEKALGIRADEPSRRYIERCRLFKEVPPPADWDGVYTLTSK